jgi:UrcA family protein
MTQQRQSRQWAHQRRRYTTAQLKAQESMKTIAQITALPLLAAAAFLAMQGAALAQPADEDAVNTITVVAPRSVTNQVHRSETGLGPATVTIRISVLYGDLNLARPADGTRLMTRIRSAARDACRHLDRLYPLVTDKSCVANAVAGATPRANAIIAAAGNLTPAAQ